MHPELARGIELFNRGAYFEAHEAIEQAWVPERDPVRRKLYHGLVQVAVGFAHLARRNRHGALTLLGSGLAKLGPLGARCGGVELEGFRVGVDRCRQAVASLAPGDLSGFDWSQVPRLSVVS